MTDFYKKFIEVQSLLKAPKGQFNKFGGYAYRSCEDIVEAVKPLLHERELFLVVNDEIVVQGDRVYVKATATVTNGEMVVGATAYAREPQTKKGMDDAQLTGATSSYARKYALNGLLGIDDSKDADTQDNRQGNNTKSDNLALKDLEKVVNESPYDMDAVLKAYQLNSVKQFTDIPAVINQVKEWAKQ